MWMNNAGGLQVLLGFLMVVSSILGPALGQLSGKVFSYITFSSSPIPKTSLSCMFVDTIYVVFFCSSLVLFLPFFFFFLPFLLLFLNSQIIMFIEVAVWNQVHDLTSC